MSLAYVSAVEPDWLLSSFIPEVEIKACNGRLPITWIITDSSVEANYLLERIQRWADNKQLAFRELTLSPSDPFLLWEDLFGSVSEVGLLSRAPGLIGIRNGCLVPLEFLSERINYLRQICVATQVNLLFPIFHETLYILRNQLKSGEIIEVPRFTSFTQARRIEVLEQLTATAVPSLGRQERLWLARELVQAQPNSRAEVEFWVNYYAEQSDIQKAFRISPPAPPVERFPSLPPSCPTRDQLAAAFGAAFLKIDEASNLFQGWMGRPLVRRIEKVVEPFLSDSPLWWFSASVSALSCQLFDGMDPAFEFLQGFDVVSGGVASAPPDPFFRALRSLRTAMQHGLVIGHSRNSETLDGVRFWFQTHCGDRMPQRYHWRRLTAVLINEWDRAATRLREVLRYIPESPARLSIIAQLRSFERRLSKEEWRTLLTAAISRINPALPLDIEVLLERNLPGLQQKLQSSAVRQDSLWDAARELVEAVVVQESARCPLGTSDYEKLGIPPGRLFGRIKARVEYLWEQTPGITRDELLAEVEKWATSTGPSEQ